MVNRDVIDRRYLQLKLNRDRRTWQNASVRSYIDGLKAWLLKSTKRTKRPGGIGK